MNPPLALSPVAVHRTVYLVPVQVSYWPLSYPSSSVHRGRPPAAGPPGGAAPSADVSAEIYVCVHEPARRSNTRLVSQNLSKQNSIKCLWICYICVMMFGNQEVWTGQKNSACKVRGEGNRAVHEREFSRCCLLTKNERTIYKIDSNSPINDTWNFTTLYILVVCSACNV